MLYHLKYKLVFLELVFFFMSCNEVQNTQTNIQDKKQINEEMLMLYKKIDSLETQLEKCDNWINILESKDSLN